MNKFRSFLALSAAIITLSFVSVNAQNYKAAKSSPNRTVEQQVYKELLKLPRYGVFDFISFRVNGSTVTLDGKVSSLGTKSQAAKYVKDVAGITTVINNIEDLPPSPFDDRIRREALRTFTDRGPAQYFATFNPDVRIIVDGGRITLEGYVARSSDSNLLNILANSISGVFEVTNNLVVGKQIYR